MESLVSYTEHLKEEMKPLRYNLFRETEADAEEGSGEGTEAGAEEGSNEGTEASAEEESSEGTEAGTVQERRMPVFCAKCGSRLEKDAVFCVICGNKA